MMAYVIDANVPVVASGRAPHASPSCVLNCVRKLRDVHTRGRVVLDNEMRILREYMTNLSMSGQPGAGDYFMKWVWENQGVSGRCERVALTPRTDDPEDFVEFPEDTRLISFDRSDRKYVAVALASQSDPVVLNATDSDWWDYREALRTNGVQIEFLCPDQFSEDN